MSQARFMSSLRERHVRLAERLAKAGYRFCDVATRTYLGPPVGDPNSEALEEVLEMLAKHAIALPVALRSFWEIVGSLEFQGVPPEAWSGCDYPDPVSIVPVDIRYMRAEVERWLDADLEEALSSGPPGPFWFQVAGDHVHKAGYSGGSYDLFFDCDDPKFVGERFDTRFMGYLRICSEWGGFPGLSRSPGHSWPMADLLRDLPAL